MNRILVTGGAGYVGSGLVRELLRKGYRVTVLDNLLHGDAGLCGCFSLPGFRFIKGDVRDPKTLGLALADQEMIVHLAAYVGFHICESHPDAARRTNLDATLEINRRRGETPIIFASTCSCYGAAENQTCLEEDTPLNPLTLYAETKAQAERAIHEKGASVCLRFATAFGVAPRLRLDLLVNDFCYRARMLRKLVVYEGTFRRPLVHVGDMVNALMLAIGDFDLMNGEVYNVGSADLTLTKAQIAHAIAQKIDFQLDFAESGHDEDRRNYEVSFDKISALGFRTRRTLSNGLDELLYAIASIHDNRPYCNA